MKVLNLVNFEKEAESIVEQSKKDAEEIINNAKLHAEKLQKESFEKGSAEAKEYIENTIMQRENEIRNDLTNKLTSDNAKFVQFFGDELRKSVNDKVDQISSLVINTAILIAEKIIHKEVNIDNNVISAVLKEALNYVAFTGKYKIRVNPAFLGKVQELIGNIKTDPLFSNAVFEAAGDESIDSCGCIVESGTSMVDATLQEQLSRIREFLK
ncbi:MAG: hypothetical protein HY606_11180 [Planctomycetes bacterium]|nr:hypothetical protein [Planctomycetota bacterium]